MRDRILLPALLVAASVCSVLMVARSKIDVPQHGLERSEMRIATKTGEIRIFPEVAVTPVQQEVGMMGRRALTDRDAMFFPMTKPAQASFWMKDTPSSLDLIFIGPDHTVESMAVDAAPYSEATILSSGPVVGVLETNAGFVRRNGILAGDPVTSKAFEDGFISVDNQHGNGVGDAPSQGDDHAPSDGSHPSVAVAPEAR